MQKRRIEPHKVTMAENDGAATGFTSTGNASTVPPSRYAFEPALVVPLPVAESAHSLYRATPTRRIDFERLDGQHQRAPFGRQGQDPQRPSSGRSYAGDRSYASYAAGGRDAHHPVRPVVVQRGNSDNETNPPATLAYQIQSGRWGVGAPP
jgi:hypothetical protein